MESTPLPLDGVDETMWLDVIQKMDEVYSQLVQDEIVLEEKNAELEDSQRFIFSVLSAMSDVLIACNRAGDIEQTNAALQKLVGLDETALLGLPVTRLLADAGSIAAIELVLGQSQVASAVVELNLIDAQHGVVPVDVNCTRRRDSLGKCVGYVFVGRPMGELRRAYDELSSTHEALKRTQQQLLHAEKMASLGRLVAGVAHELNNPISFVLGNVHALKRYSERLAQYVAALHAGDADAPALRERLRIDHMLADLPSLIDGTLEGAHRTTDIVNGLRRFSAVDREERVPVDLNGVIERAIHWISKGGTPHFTVHWTPGAPLLVPGNAGKLLQVLMNLITNARDAATDGAPVQLWISAQAGEEGIVLRLHDNGSGIAADHLLRIFEPFFTTKPIGKGTGLGLSISYGIIEQHGGVLSARNHPDGGAEFVITLPGSAA
ncbi:Signal transduction histidine kinase HoxJ (hydrogenase regulation) [Oxalobacteraceae bacterium IMCC9480]|nr:Signal transduction histidine kinase HoxJ (hydrogenase regulation) [Oxalobacteraceae bacterium IMCC9480]NDP60862.1 PAS domain-containing protein [Oxalobacteraceae bacterium]